MSNHDEKILPMSNVDEKIAPEMRVESQVESAETSGRDTVLERLGRLTITALLIGLVIQIASMGFIAFMWYGNTSYRIWHAIVVRNWTTRAVTLTSLALRISTALQGGYCIAMLAAVGLEKVTVPVKNVTGISLMRAGSSSEPIPVLLRLLWPIYKSKGGKRKTRIYIQCLILAVLTTVTLSQFASTALVGDLSQQSVPSKRIVSYLNVGYPFTNSGTDNDYVGDGSLHSKDNKTRYGYDYRELESSYWEEGAPPTWPAFAEYSEAPHTAPGVDDTGVSLRAFLPFGSVQDRQTIRNYTGKAMVLDSRVTCQVPHVTNASHEFVDSGSYRYFGVLKGTVEPTKKTPGMLEADGPIDFACVMSLMYQPSFPRDFTICQLKTKPDGYLFLNSIHDTPYTFPGGLQSMFRAPGGNETGTAFLIISNIASDSATSTVYSNDTYTVVPAPDAPGSFAISLCFASYDAADRHIEAYSDRNRSEPSVIFDEASGKLDMTRVIHQLDTGYHTSEKIPTAEKRGILHLKKRSDWTEAAPNDTYIYGPDQLQYVKGGTTETKLKQTYGARPALTPYVVKGMSIRGGLIQGIHDSSVWSVVYGEGNAFSRAKSDSSDIAKIAVTASMMGREWASQAILALWRHPAVALQTILTSVAGLAYYERIAEYQIGEDATQVFFITTQSPGGPFGTKRTNPAHGFMAVLALLIVHLALVAVVVGTFLRYSKVSRIGDGWQAIGQVGLSADCGPILTAAKHPGGKRAVGDGGIGNEGVTLDRATMTFRRVATNPRSP